MEPLLTTGNVVVNIKNNVPLLLDSLQHVRIDDKWVMSVHGVPSQVSTILMDKDPLVWMWTDDDRDWFYSWPLIVNSSPDCAYCATRHETHPDEIRVTRYNKIMSLDPTLAASQTLALQHHPASQQRRVTSVAGLAVTAVLLSGKGEPCGRVTVPVDIWMINNGSMSDTHPGVRQKILNCMRKDSERWQNNWNVQILLESSVTDMKSIRVSQIGYRYGIPVTVNESGLVVFDDGWRSLPLPNVYFKTSPPAVGEYVRVKLFQASADSEHELDRTPQRASSPVMGIVAVQQQQQQQQTGGDGTHAVPLTKPRVMEEGEGERGLRKLVERYPSYECFVRAVYEQLCCYNMHLSTSQYCDGAGRYLISQHDLLRMYLICPDLWSDVAVLAARVSNVDMALKLMFTKCEYTWTDLLTFEEKIEDRLMREDASYTEGINEILRVVRRVKDMLVNNQRKAVAEGCRMTSRYLKDLLSYDHFDIEIESSPLHEEVNDIIYMVAMLWKDVCSQTAFEVATYTYWPEEDMMY